MTFRERLEANPLYSVLAALLAGFIAGVGAYEAVLRIAQLETVSRSELQALRRQNGSPSIQNDSSSIQVDRPPSAVATSTQPSTQPSIDAVLPPFQLRTLPNVTPETLEEVMNGIRADLKVRPLAPLEAGNPIASMPAGTYGFLFASFLEPSSDGKMAGVLEHGKVDRTGLRGSDFEIAKLPTGDVIIITFVSPTDAPRIANLDGKIVHKVTLSPRPWSVAPTLVLLPLHRFVAAREREIEIEPDEEIFVIDAAVR